MWFACCMGSGVVVLEYSAIQRLMHEIKQKKKICPSFFEHYIFVIFHMVEMVKMDSFLHRVFCCVVLQ